MDATDMKPRKWSFGIPGILFVSVGWTPTPPDFPNKGTWDLPGDLPGYMHAYADAFGWVSIGGYVELV